MVMWIKRYTWGSQGIREEQIALVFSELRKAVYEVKQVLTAQCEMIAEFLFYKCVALIVSSLFIKEHEGKVMVVLIYVDMT